VEGTPLGGSARSCRVLPLPEVTLTNRPRCSPGNSVLSLRPNTPWTRPAWAARRGAHLHPCRCVFNVVTLLSTIWWARAHRLSPLVDMISFTARPWWEADHGEGRIDPDACGFLELGGKSAMIGGSTTPTSQAVIHPLRRLCMHGVQGCAKQTRMLSHPLALCRERGAISCARPRCPTGSAGLRPCSCPLISAKHRDRCLGYIEKGSKGSKLVLGCWPPRRAPAESCNVEPTLFRRPTTR